VRPSEAWLLSPHPHPVAIQAVELPPTPRPKTLSPPIALTLPSCAAAGAPPLHTKHAFRSSPPTHTLAKCLHVLALALCCVAFSRHPRHGCHRGDSARLHRCACHHHRHLHHHRCRPRRSPCGAYQASSAALHINSDFVTSASVLYMLLLYMLHHWSLRLHFAPLSVPSGLPTACFHDISGLNVWCMHSRQCKRHP
jgi:hypothetical protein